jgi:hypothetical protein
MAIKKLTLRKSWNLKLQEGMLDKMLFHGAFAIITYVELAKNVLHGPTGKLCHEGKVSIRHVV